MYNMKASEIIQQGLAHGESYELINERLKQAGCDFHLEKSRPEGWTEQEMKDGFNAGESAIVPTTLADLMKRDVSMAGREIDMLCKEGKYKITWDENGYAIKAVRQNV